MTITNLLTAFISIGVTEAIIKPIARRWVQRRILKAAPKILRQVDQRLPELLDLPTGKELEDKVRSIAEEVTGESWESENLDLLFTIFDLRKVSK